MQGGAQSQPSGGGLLIVIQRRTIISNGHLPLQTQASLHLNCRSHTEGGICPHTAPAPLFFTHVQDKTENSAGRVAKLAIDVLLTEVVMV